MQRHSSTADYNSTHLPLVRRLLSLPEPLLVGFLLFLWLVATSWARFLSLPDEGRYVGVADRAEDDFVFAERLEELNEELTVLNNEASELEQRIANNVAKLLEAAL